MAAVAEAVPNASEAVKVDPAVRVVTPYNISPNFGMESWLFSGL